MYLVEDHQELSDVDVISTEVDSTVPRQFRFLEDLLLVLRKVIDLQQVQIFIEHIAEILCHDLLVSLTKQV